MSFTTKCLGMVLVAMVTACARSEPPADPAAGPGGATAPAAASPSKTTADACAMFSASEIGGIVGNPVLDGRPYAGPEVCEWDTQSPDQVDVLLTVRLMGGIRAPALCADLGTTTGRDTPLTGVGERAYWKYARGSLFSSGDLEACNPKGFVALTLNGKADEARLKQAATTLAQQTFKKM